MWTLILKIPFNQQFKHLTFPLLGGFQIAQRRNALR
jgi:hypothetical protein